MAVGNVLRATVNTASAGDVTVVAAVAGQAVYVLSMMLQTCDTTTVEFKDGTTAVTTCGPFTGAAAVSSEFKLDQRPWTQAWVTTTAGNALKVNNSAAKQITMVIEYIQA